MHLNYIQRSERKTRILLAKVQLNVRLHLDVTSDDSMSCGLFEIVESNKSSESALACREY